jgi:hypothetical protein
LAVEFFLGEPLLFVWWLKERERECVVVLDKKKCTGRASISDTSINSTNIIGAIMAYRRASTNNHRTDSSTTTNQSINQSSYQNKDSPSATPQRRLLLHTAAVAVIVVGSRKQRRRCNCNRLLCTTTDAIDYDLLFPSFHRLYVEDRCSLVLRDLMCSDGGCFGAVAVVEGEPS